MPKFDWYQGTIHGHSVASVTDYFIKGYGLADLVPCTPKNGYERGAKAIRGDITLAEFWYGGNEGIHIKMTGDKSPEGSKLIRNYDHRVTRVDSCIDWVESGLFDKLATQLTMFAVQSGIKIKQQGDWVRGESRTLYLGSRNSVAQLVLYEKGYESDGDKNWVRLEARVYPKGERGYLVSRWTPRDVFSGSAWMTKAMESIGFNGLMPKSIGTVWRPSDTERSRMAICRQYRRVLENWADEVGGWQNIGKEIQEKIRNQQQKIEITTTEKHKKDSKKLEKCL